MLGFEAGGQIHKFASEHTFGGQEGQEGQEGEKGEHGFPSFFFTSPDLTRAAGSVKRCLVCVLLWVYRRTSCTSCGTDPIFMFSCCFLD